jgi:Ca2+-binding RTX toxin-like protein
MVLQVITADTVTAGLAVNLDTTDSAYVTSGVTVQNTNATDQYDVAIESWGDDQSVDVQGIVLSFGMTIQLGSNGTTSVGEYVHVGESGYVESSAHEAIAFLASDSIIDNDGHISGATNGIAIWSDGANPEDTRSHVNNSGYIHGATNGIYLDSTEAVTVRNSGIIDGGDNALSASKDGAITVFNSGVMKGNVSLGSGNDIYDGSGGEVDGYVFGWEGNDQITGGTRSDLLYGGDGKDKIAGAGGDDLLWGNAGADRLAGGSGADEFYYRELDESLAARSSRDLITDFSHADGDYISLHEIDANSATGKNNDFTFIGTSDFSGKAGEVRYEISGNSTLVYANIDTDNAAEIVIELVGKHKLTAGDFDL